MKIPLDLSVCVLTDGNYSQALTSTALLFVENAINVASGESVARVFGGTMVLGTCDRESRNPESIGEPVELSCFIVGDPWIADAVTHLISTMASGRDPS